MCGIIALSSNQNITNQLITSLKHLEYRGYDSWGIGLVPNNKQLQTLPSTKMQSSQTRTNPYLYKQVGQLSQALLPQFPPAHLGLGHTRWATHGDVTRANAHPHADCNASWLVVHNGIIENVDILKANLIKSGHRLASQTDTEIIAHLLEELNLTHSPDQAFIKASTKLQGQNAVVALHAASQTLYAAQLGAPLVVGKSSKAIALCSDIPTLNHLAGRISPMLPGQIIKIHHQTVSPLFPLSPLSWHKTSKQPSLNSPNHPTLPANHAMFREIQEQSAMYQRLAKRQPNPKLVHLIHKSPLLITTGCGTALHAAQLAAQLWQPYVKTPILALPASDAHAYHSLFTANCLLIAFSQSGETRDTLNLISQAKSQGAQVAAFVNVNHSTLTKAADVVQLLDAGPEVAVAATKSFTAMLLWIIKISAILNQQTISSVALYRPINDIQSKCRDLSSFLFSHSSGFILGHGLTTPIAFESALKIKEVSYHHFEAFSAGELKHGVIALIEKDTPVLVHNADQQMHPSLDAAVHQVKARGARVIGISPTPHPAFTHHLPVQSTGPISLLLHAEVGQFLAYQLAVTRGLNPDRPRNLAKSVTVI